MSIFDLMFGYINKLGTPETTEEGKENLWKYMQFWLAENVDPCMTDWVVRYSVSSASVRCLGHYMDMGLNNALREHYLNGSENYDSDQLKQHGGPAPKPGTDGYYYYSQYMSRMTVPMIVISSSAGALVSQTNTFNNIISQKTPTSYDEWYVMKDTGHFDVALGKRTPCDVYPQIGYWLEMVDALSANPPNTGTTVKPVEL
jgi:hypothetical protein